MRSLVRTKHVKTPTMLDAKEKFLDLVSPEPNSGCWLWLGGTFADGYGCFCIGKEFDRWRAHRASVRLFVGEFDEELCVLHKCDNKHCVNPGHLFLGTHTDNSNDKVRKRRHKFGERHSLAKIKESQVGIIRADRRSNKSIAKDYGVSDTTIAQIKRRETWRHV